VQAARGIMGGVGCVKTPALAWPSINEPLCVVRSRSIQLNALSPGYLRTALDQPDDGVGRRLGWEDALGVGEVDQEIGAQTRAFDPIEHGQKAGAAAPLIASGGVNSSQGSKIQGAPLHSSVSQGSRVTRARTWPLRASSSAMNSVSSRALMEPEVSIATTSSSWWLRRVGRMKSPSRRDGRI